jgi:hypothetical protein
LGCLTPAGLLVSEGPTGLSPTAVPRKLAPRVHPLVSFASPTESTVRTRPSSLDERHLPWGFVPHRDISRWSPRARASQARFVPPSTFLTSSTVCSSLGLAGLFHPTATSGMNPSGVFPPSQPYHLVGGRGPLAVDRSPCSPACAESSKEAAPSSGLCSAPESVTLREGLAHAPSDPLLGFTSPGLSVHRPCRRFHGDSAHGLPSQARSSSCLRPTYSVFPTGSPTRVSRHPPTRSRFPACSPRPKPR